jgi:hypothetical protein
MCTVLLQVPAAGAQTYAKDDFFDQLSCDTLERLQVNDEGGGCCAHACLLRVLCTRSSGCAVRALEVVAPQWLC